MRIRPRFFVGVGLIVVAIGYLIFSAISTTSEYYLTVPEVAARQAELGGQALRVAGRVKAGHHQLGSELTYAQIRDRADSRRRPAAPQ